MKQRDIEEILTSAHYKVLSCEPFCSYVVLAPNEKMVLCSVITEQQNIDELIQSEITRLGATRNQFVEIISDTLEDIEVTISLAIICNSDIKISNKTHLLLFMNNISLVKYDGTKRCIYKSFPKIKKVAEDEVDLENFHAYSDYIKTVISYITKNQFDPRIKIIGTPISFSTLNNVKSEGESNVFSSPRELAAEVKKYVKGQDHVIDRVAIPFFQHIESMRNKTTCEVKTSFLLAGNSGTGKSEIMRRFCQVSGVPFITINTADCCPTAWKGPHISDHIGYYIKNSSDIEQLRYAVLFFDEVDKVTHHDLKLVGSAGSDWDMDMQRELLRLYDKTYSILIEKQAESGIVEKYRLPVDNLLICYAGAFSGINKVIDRRLDRQSKVGFNTPYHSKNNDSMAELHVEDLEKWGYMPELLGRIGAFYVMNPMSEDLIYEIITTASENIIDAHKTQCSQYNITLRFEEGALRYIAKKAMKSKFGFRSVKTVLSRMMESIYFDCDKYAGQKFIVDKHFIDEQNYKNLR